MQKWDYVFLEKLFLQVFPVVPWPLLKGKFPSMASYSQE